MKHQTSLERMREWIRSPAGADFLEALGTSGSTQWHEPMAAALSKIICYLHGSFPLMKDHTDRELRCEPLERFLSGEDVPKEELTTAIVLLLQSFGAAVEANRALRQSLEQLRRSLDQRRRLPYRYSPMRA